ncbi:hypothetical protein AKG34_04190 [Peribacillus butanolivorans]|nr:hypothetical protein AKG34_04190 [Peribacillus butanolivorans]KQU16966.1 hypothetical protein ASG65_08605 [Bacillus sp. Leaf13]KRF55300.1 hypothetical protein ASG99_11305 [Bacillus sp. Soil768D1]
MKFIFLLGLICLCGMGYFLRKAKNPGIYPPKRVHQTRAFALGLPGVFLLFIWFMWVLIH